MLRIREQKVSIGNDYISPDSLNQWEKMKNSKEVNVPVRSDDFFPKPQDIVKQKNNLSPHIARQFDATRTPESSSNK